MTMMGNQTCQQIIGMVIRTLERNTGCELSFKVTLFRELYMSEGYVKLEAFQGNIQ